MESIPQTIELDRENPADQDLIDMIPSSGIGVHDYDERYLELETLSVIRETAHQVALLKARVNILEGRCRGLEAENTRLTHRVEALEYGAATSAGPRAVLCESVGCGEQAIYRAQYREGRSSYVCKQHGVAHMMQALPGSAVVHLDGSRLWEAAPVGRRMGP